MEIKIVKINQVKPNPETWKQVLNYEDLYLVSNYGNVMSLKSRHGKSILLKKCNDKSGYEIVTLCKNGEHKTKSVHRLVMTAFYGNNKLQVNHIDGNKKNNKLENLEFVTAKQNILHAKVNGFVNYNTTKIAESKRKLVLMINPNDMSILKIYESCHDAAKQTGYNRGNISTACRLRNKLAYGKLWKYAD